MIHHGTLEEVERAYSSYDDDDEHEPRKKGGRKSRQLVLPLQRGVALVKSYRYLNLETDHTPKKKRGSWFFSVALPSGLQFSRRKPQV
jgi:hypothetical protein